MSLPEKLKILKIILDGTQPPQVTFLLLEGGNRFSFRFGVSVDLAGVDVLGEDVADDVAGVERLGVLKVFGNGGRSFFCLLTSPMTKVSYVEKSNEMMKFSDLPSIEISAIQLAVIPVLAILAGLGLRAELTERR